MSGIGILKINFFFTNNYLQLLTQIIKRDHYNFNHLTGVSHQPYYCEIKQAPPGHGSD